MIVNTKGPQVHNTYEIDHSLGVGQRLKISVFQNSVETVILDVEVEQNEILRILMRGQIQETI